MPKIKATDMGRVNRLVLVESPRIRGTFAVLLGSDRTRPAWVTTHDVTVYFSEARNSGRVLYSDDLCGSVTADGIADLSTHMVSSDKLADVQDVWDEMLAVLTWAAKAARDAAALAAAPHETETA